VLALRIYDTDLNNSVFCQTLRELAISVVSDYPEELSVTSTNLLSSAIDDDYEVQVT